MNGNLSAQASNLYRSVTLGTRTVILICLLLYAYGLVFGINLSNWCMRPFSIAGDWSLVYTFLSSAFFHFSLLHIVLNMVSFYPMGTAFERTKGTLNTLYLILLFAFGISIVHFAISSALFMFQISTSGYFQCSAGFSGVLFCILTIECHNHEGSRNFFGFSFPSRVYPWILLFVIQLVMGNVSFYGHLSGILFGYVYIYKLLDPLVPTNLLNKLERSRFMGWYISRDGYITSPNSDSLPFSLSGNREIGLQFPSFSVFSQPQIQPFGGAGRVLGTGDSLSKLMEPSAPPAPPGETAKGNVQL